MLTATFVWGYSPVTATYNTISMTCLEGFTLQASRKPTLATSAKIMIGADLLDVPWNARPHSGIWRRALAMWESGSIALCLLTGGSARWIRRSAPERTEVVSGPSMPLVE